MPGRTQLLKKDYATDSWYFSTDISGNAYMLAFISDMKMKFLSYSIKGISVPQMIDQLFLLKVETLVASS